MQTIHKKKRKKIFYRIKLDKAQINRKKWTHTLDNANVALLPDLNAIKLDKAENRRLK